MNTTRFLISGLIFAGFVPGNVWAQSSGPESPLAVEQLGRLPLAFEKHGDGFVARGQGYVIGLEAGKLVVGVAPKDKAGHAVSLELVGAGAGRAVPGGELPGKVNYIHGNDPRKWQIGLPTYERVTYPNSYPGIDVVYYGNQRQLEFDFVVRPEADPEAIRLKAQGAGRLSIDGSGALNLGEAGGFRLALPQIYQEVNGEKKRIPGHYAIVGPDEIAFRIDPWDRTRPLVIDPTIVQSQGFGGGLGSTVGQAIAVDSMGNIILTGYTTATDFPLLNPAQSIFQGTSDIFVSKINPSGTMLVYSTYLGGSSSQVANAIALDSTGAAWFTGYTSSTDFPLMNAAQSAYGGGPFDAFVAKLSSTGTLQVSTYLGGNNSDYAYGIAVDPGKSAYVTGSTYGTFPVTAGVLQTGSGNGFVTKYSDTGAMEYSTEFGGSLTYGQAIAVDPSGNAYVTGTSYATTVPGMPAGSAQPTNKGSGDAYAAKINPTATGYVFFTFFGGAGLDQGKAIAVRSNGATPPLFSAYVAGQTSSTGLATASAAQKVPGGGVDAFVFELNPAGSQIVYSSYLGGERVDTVTGMAVDATGAAYVTGYTDSPNFPTVLPLESMFPGNPVSLFKSANSGNSWAADDMNIPGAVYQISINPTNGLAQVVETESGIYRTKDGGTTWTQQFDAQFSSYGSTIARSPVAPSTIYATACCSQVYESIDDGVTWNFMGSTPNGALGLMADPLTASTVYLFGYNSPGSPDFFKSINAGKTWTPAATGLPAAQIASMADTTDGSLYVDFSYNGTSYGVYKSTNQGGSWAPANTGLPPSYAGSHSLSASGTTVYFANGNIYKTTNGGATWVPGPGSLYSAYQVAVDPKNPSLLYVATYSSTLEESTDGGATWSSPESFPTGTTYYNSELAIDPSNPANVFVTAPMSQAGFVAKLNPSGSALLWSTYLGSSSATGATNYGSSGTFPYGIAAAGPGNVLVTGYVSGGGIPVTSQSLPAGGNGNTETFITEFSDPTVLCSTFSVNPKTALVSQYGGTPIFSVVAPTGCTWTAVTNESWAPIISGASGTGIGTVKLQVSSNASGALRTANLNVTSGFITHTVTIAQDPLTCTWGVDKTSYLVPAAGGPVSAIMTTTAACEWAAINNSPGAVSFTTPSSGTGPATIGLKVTANPGNTTRNMYLTVGTTQIHLSQGTGAPVITGISDSADNSAPPLSGGGLSSLYGMDLATSTAVATGIPLPFTLGGSTLAVDGFKAAMSFASPTQINFQIPIEVTPGINTIVVSSGGYSSQPFTVNIVPASPGIFAGKILSSNGKVNTAANPIGASGTATVFYTGQGATNPPVGDGKAAPASPISKPVNVATATVGGLPAAVAFNGLTPGSVGVAQANVVIPAGITLAGSYPVIITENARPSAPATIYISGAAPTVTKVVPITAPIGSGPTPVTITGTNFGGGATVQFTAPGGAITLVTPNSIQPTQITVTIPATLLTVEGAGKIGIDNGLGTVSNHWPFTITPPVATTTALVSSSNPSVLGKLVKYTATVIPNIAVGNMTIRDGSYVFGTSPLVGGTAEFTTTLLPSGSHSMKAEYLSPGGFLSSASAVLTQTIKAAGANDFAASVQYPTSSYPSSVIVEDFNNDNKADLAVATASGTQIFLGKGDGTFGLPIGVTGGGYGAALTAGDFNRDGNTDLAVAFGNTISILPGKGDGTFGTAVPYTVTSASFVSIATGDVNGDGKLDLVGASEFNGTVNVLLGNGDGTFGPAASFNSGAESTSVAIGDVNGDGKADLVVTNSAGTVNVLLGKGDGTFPTAASYPAGTAPYRVVIADLNGDGKPDLAVLNQNYNESVLKGKGDGTFGAPAYIDPSGSSYPQGMAVGDINGDGKPDIVISSFNYNSIGVLLGKGDLTFQPPVFYAVGNNPQPLAIGEFNGDGRSDIVVGNNGGSNLSVLLGLETTGPLFTSTLLTSSANPSTAGQGVTLTTRVSPSTATGTVTFRNGAAVLGTGTLFQGTATLTLTTLPPGANSLTAVYPGDALKVYAPSTSPVLTQQVNKNPTNTALLSSLNPSDTGKSVTLRALVSPSTVTGSVTFRDGSTLLGVGTLIAGSATSTVSTFTAGTHSLTAVYSGDADDAVSTSALTQTVYASRPTTTTTQVSSLNPSTFGQAVTFTATVAPATATGSVTFYDGLAVLETEPLAAGKAVLKTTLLAADKRGVRAFYGGDPTHMPSASAALPQTVNSVAGNGFAPALNYGTLTEPFTVAVGDFNGDGKADLAIGGYSIGGVSVLLGNGDGTFKPFVTYSTGGFVPAIAIGDFNGDGKPDLVVGTSSGVGILLGSGDGTFKPVADYPIGDASTSPGAVTTGDFNGDGHDDIATANNDGTLSVLLGKGDGTLESAVNFGSGSFAQGLVTADFNGDGIPDLAADGGGTLRIFLGNGDGSFRGEPVVTGSYSAYSFVAGDFNGDGKTDLAIPTGSSIYVLLGKGDGTFQPPVPYSAGAGEYEAYGAATGDFNGDGKVDLVVANFGTAGTANVLLGNGDGTFQPPVNHATGATLTYSVAVADFNGDGRADIVTANFDNNNVSILLGTLTPTVNSVTPANTLVGSSATALTIAGSNFLAGATVSWKSPAGLVTIITPSLVKTGQVSVTIPGTLLGTAGTAQIAVTNGTNELSSPVPFYILPFRVSSVAPEAAPVGSAATLVTVAGTNLLTATKLIFTPPGGAPVTVALNTPLQATKGIATIPSTSLATAGTAQIALANAAGAVSNELPFYITPFTIATVMPNTTIAGSAATKVTVTGTNLSTATKLAFTPPGASAPVMIGLTTIAAGQAVATIPVQYLATAGAAQVALANAAGVLSNPLLFTITPAP